MTEDAHLLIVDDHREIRDLVGQLLKREGFKVSAAANGEEMKQCLARGNIDLIVLDLMLPKVDGLILCRDLRAGGSNIPIVMLTAKGDEIDRVLGLEMGADDYVVKPFSARELLARIKAVLRRVRALPPLAGGPVPTVYRFGRWSLFPARRELESDDGVVVPISSGDYNLLSAFIRHPKRVLGRDQLLDLTRGRSATPFDRSIDLQVSRLRKKIEDDPSDPKLIKTVWGDGYVFTPDVTSE